MPSKPRRGRSRSPASCSRRVIVSPKPSRCTSGRASPGSPRSASTSTRRSAFAWTRSSDGARGENRTRREMERSWAEHLRHEFVTKDVEATLATMVDDASVDHVPVHTGGRGKAELRAFYRDVFIGSWPGDLEMTTTNRVFGRDQLVEEDHLRFTHENAMEWFLPRMPATNRVVDVDFVIVL